MAASPRPRAIVTGASRGIGKATAIALAGAGYDLAITARTVHRSDQATEPTGNAVEPLPGSLEETAEAVEQAGGACNLIRLDLGDPDRLLPAAEEALHALGGADLLVNNAIWTGPGNYERFLDTAPQLTAQRIFGNITAQLMFSYPVVKTMVEAGGGLVLNMTSGAAYAEPFAQPGQGGWGLGYTVSKGGFHRMAIQLAFEYGADGLIALNVQPGFVATERVKMVGGPVSNIAARGVEPAVIGAAIASVAADPRRFDNGSCIRLQDVARSIGLLG